MLNPESIGTREAVGTHENFRSLAQAVPRKQWINVTMTSFMKNIPLLLYPVVLYNAAMLIDANALQQQLIMITLVSGAQLSFNVNDLVLTVSLMLLYLEILKATRISSSSILDHALSLLLFVVCLVEFLVIPAVGTSVFFLILLMTLLDVVAGFTVTISTARRDVAIDPSGN